MFFKIRNLLPLDVLICLYNALFLSFLQYGLIVWGQAYASYIDHGGGGFFHSKGTWGCAAHKGILFRTSSLAKGILFGNFSRI